MRLKILHNFSTVKEGDTNAVFKLQVLDEYDYAYDLMNKTVNISLANNTGKILSIVPTIESELGVFSFSFAESDVTGYGEMRLEVRVTDENGVVSIVPSRGHYRFNIEKNLDALGEVVTNYTLESVKQEVAKDFGDLTALKTSNKNTLVDAINEIYESPIGSGVLVYETLSDLQTAYPDGTTTPVWIVSDSAWYYWDGIIVADTTPPGNVTALSTSNLDETTLTLSWNASVSTDVASYEVYQGNTLLADVQATTYNVSDLTKATAYTFTIKAKDSSGNVASGTSVNVTTVDNSVPADTTPPDDVMNLTASNITHNSLDLTWTASVIGDVASYEVYQDGGLVGTTVNTNYSITGLSAETSYDFTIKSKDGANNTSTGVTITELTIAAPDVGAPTVTATPNGGTFTDTIDVTLSADETATIYYTLDGSTPTTASSVYTSPVTLTDTTTLKHFGKDTAGNESVVQTVTYTRSSNAEIYLVDSAARGTLTNASLTWKTMAFKNKQAKALEEIYSSGAVSKEWELWELDATGATMKTQLATGVFGSSKRYDANANYSYAYATLGAPINLEAAKYYAISINNISSTPPLQYSSDVSAVVNNAFVDNTERKYTSLTPANGVSLSNGFVYDVKIKLA